VEAIVPTGTFSRVDDTGSVALRTDGTVEYWSNAKFTETTPPGKFVEIAAGWPYDGGIHNCAIKDDKSLTCWGETGNLIHASPPKGSFMALSGGPRYFCAAMVDGTVKCWVPRSGCPRPLISATILEDLDEASGGSRFD